MAPPSTNVSTGGTGIGRLAAALLPSSASSSIGRAATAADSTPSHWLLQEQQWRARIEREKARTEQRQQQLQRAGAAAGASTAVAPSVVAASGPGAGGERAGSEAESDAGDSHAIPVGSVPLWSRSYADADLEQRIRDAAARAEAEAQPAQAATTAAAATSQQSPAAAPASVTGKTPRAAALDARRLASFNTFRSAEVKAGASSTAGIPGQPKPRST